MLVAPGRTSNTANAKPCVTIAIRLLQPLVLIAQCGATLPLFSLIENVKERTPIHSLLVRTHSVVPLNNTFFV